MNNSTYLPRDFTGNLVVAARLWRRMTRTVTARHGIAEAGVAPLIWLGRLGGGVRQNALADHCGIEGASLVRIIDDLSKAGLVERRADPADRRAKTLHLTAEGERKVAVVEAEFEALRQRVFGGLPRADIAAVERVVETIKQAAAVELGGLELAD